jgi:S1/P1 nuclease
MNIRFLGNTARHVLAALVVFFAISSDAWAWGDQGHKVICEIAFRLVQPNTRAEIRKLIGTDEQFNTFSDSCIWPDHPRQRASEHFVNLPRDSDGLHSETCPGASACVVTAIKRDFEVLSSSNASQAQKLESLKFLGHWVGDIHQPLHVSFEDDRRAQHRPRQVLVRHSRHVAPKWWRLPGRLLVAVVRGRRERCAYSAPQRCGRTTGGHWRGRCLEAPESPANSPQTDRAVTRGRFAPKLFHQT